MKHITVEDMIAFVTFDRIDADALETAARVNTHIRECEACLRKVRAFQVVYDELVRLGRETEVRAVAAALEKDDASLAQATELRDAPEK